MILDSDALRAAAAVLEQMDRGIQRGITFEGVLFTYVDGEKPARGVRVEWVSTIDGHGLVTE